MSNEKNSVDSLAPVTTYQQGAQLCKDGQLHKWDGPVEQLQYEDGGSSSSVTCSRCGIMALDTAWWEGSH